MLAIIVVLHHVLSFFIQANLDDCSDEDILSHINSKQVPLHQLESKLTDLTRAVKLR